MNQQPDFVALVQDAFEVLKEKFEADAVAPPQIALDQAPQLLEGAGYHSVANVILLQTKDMVKDSIYLTHTIGEEVSHYLHAQVNPKITQEYLKLKRKLKSAPNQSVRFKCNLDYFYLSNLIEMVGSYGSLIYLEKKESLAKAREMAFEKFKITAKGLPMIGNNAYSDEIQKAVASHGFGYLISCDVYLKFGDRYLVALSRIESIDFMKLVIKHPSRLEELLNMSHSERQKEIEASRLTDETPTAITEKTGRNEPCPCGSGKKYKRCCGRN
jgi:predicted transcriptional regulator